MPIPPNNAYEIRKTYGFGVMLHIIDTSVIQYQILDSLAPLTPNGNIHGKYAEDYRDAVLLCVTSLEALMDEGDRIIWVGDSKPYFRKEIIPEYKAGRAPKPDCYHDISKIIDSSEDVWRIRTMEADDLIALVATKAAGYSRIWTIDGDLMQLISPTVDWLNSAQWRPRLRTWGNWQEWFAKRKVAKKYWEKAANPHQAICSWKYNLGDKSDNYGKFTPQVIYDLLQSPVFGMVSNEELECKLMEARVCAPAKGEAAYSQLKSLGFKPPVLKLDDKDEVGWPSMETFTDELLAVINAV